MRSTRFLAFFGLMCCIGLRAVAQQKLDQATWLLGVWETKTSKGSSYESWQKTNGTSFSGMNYLLKGQDTIMLESIQLLAVQNQLFYIPTVKNQNNGQPIRFRLVEFDTKYLIFENKAHDFPQRIAYFKISADSLVAEISGTKNGKNGRQVFPMRRIKK